MRIPFNKLKNLRSGQGVWRVLFSVERDGQLSATVHYEVGLGKRVRHVFDKGQPTMWTSLRFECRRPDPLISPDWENYQRRIQFLDDAHGDGAFTKKRQADRYVADVLNGLYPEVVKRLVAWDEIDRELSKSMDEYIWQPMDGDYWPEDSHAYTPFHPDDGRLYSDEELDSNQANDLI